MDSPPPPPPDELHSSTPSHGSLGSFKTFAFVKPNFDSNINPKFDDNTNPNIESSINPNLNSEAKNNLNSVSYFDSFAEIRLSPKERIGFELHKMDLCSPKWFQRNYSPLRSQVSSLFDQNNNLQATRVKISTLSSNPTVITKLQMNIVRGEASSNFSSQTSSTYKDSVVRVSSQRSVQQEVQQEGKILEEEGEGKDTALRVASSSIDRSGHLALENIRDSLIRQEDSIIFNLIERAQYKFNKPAYDPTMIAVPGFGGSLMEYILQETEILHAKVRRYTAPPEHPFFPEVLPEIILPRMMYPQVLHQTGAQININPLIWKMYYGDLLPALVSPGDDNNYGSSVTMDVLCLQALSKRIHFGAFVAEAKFRESPELYSPLILRQDKDALMSLLTFEKVEASVVRRVELKATAFAQDIGVAKDDNSSENLKIDPKLVARLYGEWIMPLTKEVQVQYLLRRLDQIES